MFEQYNDLVSVEELCEMLSIGKNSAYKLLSSGEIKAFVTTEFGKYLV